MDKIQEVLDLGVSEFGFPSISFAAAKDGKLWTGSSGFQNIEKQEPVQVDFHRYCVGSITKTFVGVVIMQLVEEGLLELDKTALHYLGECKHKALVEETANADKASLLQVVNHQSGIPTWEFQEDAVRVMRGKDMDKNKIWKKHETLLYSTKQLLEATNEPGDAYNYSNTNYTILGLVIEAVTKNKAAHEIRKRILEPLGMFNTFLEHHEETPQEGHTSHYHWATPEFIESAGLHPEFTPVPGHPYLANTTIGNISCEWTAGGIVTTAADLIKFAEALGTPGCLLSPSIHQQMFTYHPPKVMNPGDRIYMQGVIHLPNCHGKDVYHHWGSTLGYCGFMGFFDLPGTGSFTFLTNVGLMHAFPSSVGIKHPKDFMLLLARRVLELFGEEVEEVTEPDTLTWGRTK